jgi:hypothetical protein
MAKMFLISSPASRLYGFIHPSHPYNCVVPQSSQCVAFINRPGLRDFLYFIFTMLLPIKNPLILHCNKRLAIFPSPAGMSLTNSLWQGIFFIQIVPGQGEFGSDIPAGDGKIGNLFLQYTAIVSKFCSKFLNNYNRVGLKQ